MKLPPIVTPCLRLYKTANPLPLLLHNSLQQHHHQYPLPFFPLPKKPTSSPLSTMATCVDTNSLKQPNKYLSFCRALNKSHPNRASLHTCPNLDHQGRTQEKEEEKKKLNGFDEDIWLKMQEEARADVDQEPILSNYYHTSILSHNSLERALANHLSVKLSNSNLPSSTLCDIFVAVLERNRDVVLAVKEDLRAVKERDPACISYVHCFLNFKGFLACQSHRVAHELWKQNRKILALLIQNRVSEVFAVDIHPGARIGSGILLDHATGVVIGETAVIGNNVSILHNVTLGGTGKACGDRHPKIGDGVLIGAGTCILGNIWIGNGAKVGAGSVVLKEVPDRTTAVGNPARLIGGKDNPTKLDKIPSFTMDHTWDIREWSDYVI